MPRLLLVDDDRAFLQVLQRALERRGHTVTQADTADAALTIARSQSFDGVVLDLRIGEDNGLQCLPALRALQPDASILLLTGYASIATAVEAVKRGADDYRPKPASSEEILQALFSDDTPTEADLPNTPIHPRRLEWEHLQRVMNEHDGNVSSAARALGLHRRTLQRKLAKRPVRERAEQPED
jgi:two-component system response regulator RegA